MVPRRAAAFVSKEAVALFVLLKGLYLDDRIGAIGEELKEAALGWCHSKGQRRSCLYKKTGR